MHIYFGPIFKKKHLKVAYYRNVVSTYTNFYRNSLKILKYNFLSLRYFKLTKFNKIYTSVIFIIFVRNINLFVDISSSYDFETHDKMKLKYFSYI